MRVRPCQPGEGQPRVYGRASDADLLAWSAEGDREAFQEVATRHGPFALRSAARLVQDLSVAEDVAQEALVRAWTQASQFDGRRARFTTWLYRIVFNLCIDYRRRTQPQPIPPDFDPIDPGATADQMLEADDQLTALTAALRLLPTRQRAALALVYEEGMSGAEAARALGVSIKAIERLLARARAYLRQRLESEMTHTKNQRC
jgi:RNA polymerase sigma-70 factor (ECF subfamily)